MNNQQTLEQTQELELSNEQFELTTDELSDSDLEAVSGGVIPLLAAGAVFFGSMVAIGASQIAGSRR